ncbi:MAG: hypothetical protein D6730_03140 [Bacteroidetes bacterium]|nr:MAG: hypothetical protein D6730_03140 [Bacteroidota bacterium]
MLSFFSLRIPKRLLWLLAGGLLLRLLYLLAFWDHALQGDAAWYVADADKLLRGEAYAPYWPPGLPLLIAAVGGCLEALGIANALLKGGVLAMLLYFFACSLLLYQLTARLSSQRVAWWVVLVFCLYPAFIHHSVVPLTQLPAALYLLAVPACWLAYIRQKQPGYLLLMGLCWGLLILTRPAALAALLACVLWMVWAKRPSEAAASLKNRLKEVLLVCLLPVLLLGGWEAKVYEMTGRVVWINEANSKNFFIGNNPWTPCYKSWWLGSQDERANPRFSGYYAERARIQALPAREQNQAWSRAAWQHIRQQPALFVWRTLSRLRTFWAFDTFAAGSWWPQHRWLALLLLAADAAAYLLLAFSALAGLWVRPALPYSSLLGVLVAGYTLPYLLAFSHPNYHLPLMPLLALFAAHCWQHCGLSGQAWRQFVRQRKPGFWLAAALLLFIQLEWVWHRWMQLVQG